MQTRREYAISLGLAKPTRGRMSGKAKEAIEKAEAEGMVFAETGATPKVAKPDAPAEPKAEPKPNPGDSLYISPADFRFPEGEYIAVSRDNDGKRVVHSVRECCNTCRVSLTNHACNTPTIHGNVVVKMERV